MSGVYLGHHGWNKIPNGRSEFDNPNLGRRSEKEVNRNSVIEAEEQTRCRKKLLIALTIFILLTVVVSIVLIVTIVKKK